MTVHAAILRRTGAALLAVALAFAGFLGMAPVAGADIVPTIQLGTAAHFSVLAGSTVTNTGYSILYQSLGLSPGTAVTGFPPGRVVAPATIHVANGVADQAKLDLTTAYNDAHDRPVTANTGSELGGLVLQGGVYAGPGPGKAPLLLTGELVLDGANNADSVFIFQTDSTLTTAVGSTVRLINGAQECNVFWQVGSSATLNADSVFVGNILALTSISVKDSVVVHGRALAREGAVTLENDLFRAPTCERADAGGGTTSTTADDSSSTTPTTTASTGTPVAVTPASVSTGTAATAGTAAGSGAGTAGAGSAATATRGAAAPAPRPAAPGTRVSGPPRTGGAPLQTSGGPNGPALLTGFALITLALFGATVARRRFLVRAAGLG